MINRQMQIAHIPAVYISINSNGIERYAELVIFLESPQSAATRQQYRHKCQVLQTGKYAETSECHNVCWTQSMICLFVGCLTSQQHASVCQGRICSDIFTCCHTEMEVTDQAFYLTQSQHTGTGPTSPSTDPITPGAWQDSHWAANFEVTGMTRPRKNPGASGIRTPQCMRLSLLLKATTTTITNKQTTPQGNCQTPI